VVIKSYHNWRAFFLNSSSCEATEIYPVQPDKNLYKGGFMRYKDEITGLGSRPYPLDRERRRRVLVAMAEKATYY